MTQKQLSISNRWNVKMLSCIVLVFTVILLVNTIKPSLAVANSQLHLNVISINDVSGGNLPPIAEISINQEGDNYTFDASASSDPDGTIIKYIWDFGGGKTVEGQVVTVTTAELTSGTCTLTLIDDGNAVTIKMALINDAIEISDDFESDSVENYTVISGGVTVEGGAVHGADWQKTMAFNINSLNSANQVVEADVNYSGRSADGCGLLLGVDETSQTGYITYFINGIITLKRFQGSALTYIAQGDTVYNAGNYHLKIASYGNNITVFVNGTESISVFDDTYSNGQYAGFSIFRTKVNSITSVDNFYARENLQ